MLSEAWVDCVVCYSKIIILTEMVPECVECVVMVKFVCLFLANGFC